MRTDDDLRDALDALADSAPTPADATVQMPWDLPRVWPRRAAIAVLAAACATAIVLPVGYLANHRDTGTSQAAGGSAPPLWRQPNFTVELPPGWRVESRQSAIDYTAIGVAMTTQPSVACDLMAFAPGRFNLSQFSAQGRTPTAVDGKRGFFGTIRLTTQLSSGSQALVWEYAPKAWAVSACSRPLAAQARLLEMTAAKMVHLQAGRLLVPFAVERRAGVARVADVTVYEPSVVRTVGSPVATAQLGETNGREGSIALEWGTPAREAGATPIEVGGRTGWYYRANPDLEGVVVLTPGYAVRITLPRSPGTRDVLMGMARDLRVATDPADELTWFDAATSLP